MSNLIQELVKAGKSSQAKSASQNDSAHDLKPEATKDSYPPSNKVNPKKEGKDLLIEMLKANRELFTEREAAEYLSLTNHKTLTVWRVSKRYDLPYVKLGRHVRYRKKDLDDFIESRVVR